MAEMDMVSLLPEINLITDKQLRQRVESVWKDAIESGGWRWEEIDSIPFTLLIADCKIGLISHTRAVTRTALAIAKTMSESYGEAIKIDFDLLIAGSLLHDVGKLLEYVKEEGKVKKSAFGDFLRHTFSGQALAYKHGLPAEVLHMIAYHSKEGDLGKRSVEAIIVHHADFVNFEPFRG